MPEAFSRIGNIGSLGNTKTFKEEETPGFGISALTALSPVILMAVTTIVQLIQEIGNITDNLFLKSYVQLEIRQWLSCSPCYLLFIQWE